MDQVKPRIYTPEDKDIVPRRMVRLMTGMVLLCLIMVAAHVWTGRPVDYAPPQSQIKAQRQVLLHGTMAGAVTVRAPSGEMIADLGPEEGGFVSGVWRVLQRERIKARVAENGPVTITAFQNGRMAITDPSTGWSADLMGFGQDNAAAFARLLLE